MVIFLTKFPRLTRTLLLLLALWAIPLPLSAELPVVSARAELGFLDPISHKLQLGEPATEIDLVEEAGQDVLFPFLRAEIDATFATRHRISFLYQPLNLQTSVRAERDWVVDDVTFAAGTAVEVQYGFPFYRLSYGYDLSWNDDMTLMVGGSLQLRNATFVFTSADGQQRASRRDVGPVPLLSLRYRRDFTAAFIAAEIYGIYAPIKYLNGGDSDVVGAFLDTSLRAGYAFGAIELDLNFRYLAGGAEGTSDRFTKNWLGFLTTSLGMRYYF